MTPTPAARRDWQRTLFEHPLAWLLALALAHVVSRVAISPSLKWDEGEQILWAQQLAWGYGPQPPLYTWLQWALCQLLGPSVLALALLKHALMALAYVLMGLAARQVLGPHAAVWAAASLVLLPPFGWDGVRDQSHTVLITAAVAGTWWAALRLVHQPRAAGFALLGFFLGVGVLSKYSFVLFAAALALAGLSVPAVRRAWLARGWWWTLIVGALVVAPHGLWLLEHWGLATGETVRKMDLDPGAGLWRGAGALLGALAATLALWALLAPLLARRPRALALAAPLATPTPAWARPLLTRYVALIALALLGMVFVAGVSSFRPRWVLPLLCVLPLALWVWRPAWQDPRGGRGYTRAIVGVALLILALATARPWLAGWRGDPDELNHPAPALAAQLRAAGYDGVSPIIAADHMLAGTLRTRFAHAPAIACGAAVGDVAACVRHAVAAAQQAGQGYLLVAWPGRAPPDWWAQALGPQAASTPVGTLTLAFDKMPDSFPPARYEFLWQPPTPNRVPPP